MISDLANFFYTSAREKDKDNLNEYSPKGAVFSIEILMGEI